MMLGVGLLTVVYSYENRCKYKLDSQELTEIEAHRQIRTATVLATLWLGFLGVGVFALLHVVEPQYTVPDVILEAASAMGTSGLSVGITNPDLHWIGKLILILFMWMGRVEIIPVLVLFASFLLYKCRDTNVSTNKNG
jgi:trk system potassium uptake protein TrkH